MLLEDLDGMVADARAWLRGKLILDASESTIDQQQQQRRFEWLLDTARGRRRGLGPLTVSTSVKY